MASLRTFTLAYGSGQIVHCISSQGVLEMVTLPACSSSSSLPKQNGFDVAHRISQIVAAVATVFVAILAIWGEWFRARFAGPKLELCPRNLDGDRLQPERIDSKHGPTMRYQLDVVNRRTWTRATDVQVRCTRAFCRRPDGEYTEQPFEYPATLKWTTDEGEIVWKASFKKSYRCDLGHLREADPVFTLAVRTGPPGFPNTMAPNQSVRYDFEIDATNFVSRQPLSLQIDWDGMWTPHRIQLATHLVVKVIRRV